jgi:hypothetical protein
VFRDSRVVQFKCRRRTSSYRFQCRMHCSLRDEVLFDANERAGREDLGNCVVGQSLASWFWRSFASPNVPRSL